MEPLGNCKEHKLHEGRDSLLFTPSVNSHPVPTTEAVTEQQLNNKYLLDEQNEGWKHPSSILSILSPSPPTFCSLLYLSLVPLVKTLLSGNTYQSFTFQQPLNHCLERLEFQFSKKSSGPSAGPVSVSNGRSLWPGPIHPPPRAHGQALNSLEEQQTVHRNSSFPQ